MGKQIYRLVHDEARRRALEAVRTAPAGYVVEVKQATRTLQQNARMWAMLTDVSEQVEWYGRWLSAEGWKHIFTASLKKQDTVPGIDGGVVILGQSTSNMTKAEMGDLVELIAAFGAEHGVEFMDEREGVAA